MVERTYGKYSDLFFISGFRKAEIPKGIGRLSMELKALRVVTIDFFWC